MAQVFTAAERAELGFIDRGSRPLRIDPVPDTTPAAAAPAAQREGARSSANFPSYRPGEALADRCVHAVGLFVGGIGAIVLLILAAGRDDPRIVVATIVYAVGLLAMLACSALYNAAPPSRRKELLRRLDHAAIYFMIAGTYTPFALVRFDAATGLPMLAFVWTVAACGMFLKLAYARRLEGVSIVLYLALGWSGLTALDAIVAALMPSTAALLVAGGAFYSGGVAFHLLRGMPYHQVVWHGCVVAGASCHLAAIAQEIVLA